VSILKAERGAVLYQESVACTCLASGKIFLELGGGYADEALEGLREVTLIGEAGGQSDCNRGESE